MDTCRGCTCHVVGDMYPRHVPTTCSCYPRHVNVTHDMVSTPTTSCLCSHDMLMLPTICTCHPRHVNVTHDMYVSPTCRGCSKDMSWVQIGHVVGNMHPRHAHVPHDMVVVVLSTTCTCRGEHFQCCPRHVQFAPTTLPTTCLCIPRHDNEPHDMYPRHVHVVGNICLCRG